MFIQKRNARVIHKYCGICALFCCLLNRCFIIYIQLNRDKPFFLKVTDLAHTHIDLFSALTTCLPSDGKS